MIRSLRVLLLAVLALLVAATAFAQPVSTTTAGAPFFCDARFYQTRADTSGGATTSQTFLVTYPTLTAGSNASNAYGGTNYIPIPLNAMGFNPRDNYLYALNSGPAPNNQLYRIGQSGVQLVGTIPGLPAGFVSTGGVFDRAGRFYFAGQGAGNISPSTFFRIDNIPATGTASLTIARSYALTASVTNMGDFAFTQASDGINGVLYGTTGGVHHRIQLNDGASSAVPATVTVTPNVGGIGSAFYDQPTGRFYVFNNGSATFAEITNVAGPGTATSVATPVNAPTFIPGGFVNNATDGASCILAGIQEADIRVNKTVTPTTTLTVGQTATFTVVVGNSGPSPAQSVTVAENLPAGLSFVSASASAGTYTTATGQWVIPSLPASESRTLTLVASVNSLGTGTQSFVNVAVVGTVSQAGTVTVVPLPDPNPSNNSSTATATVSVSVNLQITKTDGVGTVTAGTTTSYTITVANTGPSDAANSVLRDPAAPGLSCTLGTPACTATGASVCPTVGTGAGQLSIANLQSPAGVQIPLLKVGSTMTFLVICGVTATGL